MYDVFVDPALDMHSVIKPDGGAEPLGGAGPDRACQARVAAGGRARCAVPPEGSPRHSSTTFTHVVIDCPPALGLLTVNALVAATHLLIPIQSSYFALEGTDDLLETIEKVRQRPNPGLKILGVVITMHDQRTALGRDIRQQIRKVFGDKVFRTVISKSVRLEESPAYRESIFTFAPESSGRHRVLQPVRGGDRTCLSHAAFPKPCRCATTRTTSRPWPPRRRRPSAAWSPIEKVDPNPDQPRQAMGDLSDLVSSLTEKGIIEPLVVRQRGDRYQIIAGERRYQAAIQAGTRRTARWSSATSTTPRCSSWHWSRTSSART